MFVMFRLELSKIALRCCDDYHVQFLRVLVVVTFYLKKRTGGLAPTVECPNHMDNMPKGATTHAPPSRWKFMGTSLQDIKTLVMYKCNFEIGN